MGTKPIIYQLLPRLFTNLCTSCKPNGSIEQNGCGKMNDINDSILAQIRDLGVTHIWYTGVIEHATTTDYTKYNITSSNKYIVKGKAGSPYAIRDYYDIDPDIAVNIDNRIGEWQNLINRTHKVGMKVIMDFVPNHVAREYKSDKKPKDIKDFGETDNTNMFFSPNNNFYYITGKSFTPQIDLGAGENQYKEYPAKATGNDCYSEAPTTNDWYETIKLNYGVDPWNGSKHFSPIPSTWIKMLDILRYWSSMGIDGFRCDMAHMVPVEFWNWAISEIKKEYPSIIFIAEIYDTSLYRSYINYGGFDYLYDKVTLYDTLFNILKYNSSAKEITQCWQCINETKGHMLNFLENHDELRIASPQFCGDPFIAKPALVVSALISTCPFMIYAGQEFGECASESEGYSGNDGRTTIFDYWSVPTLRQWQTNQISNKAKELQNYYQKILRLCNCHTAISLGSMYDLMYVNPHLNRQFAFLRHYEDDLLLIVANFGNCMVETSVNIPLHAFEYLNIQQGTYSAKDLLTTKSCELAFNCNEPVRLDVPQHGAVVFELKYNG
ncbi:MAG: alpha-amylase [Bacteroidales bacterium]|nr:alpha-amylase [Candidatus Sodaliphilus aphodohippi]